MAEIDISDQSSPVVGLSTDDITPSIYEGGFKTWECALDLASHVSGCISKGWGLGEREVHIVEVSCALPDMPLSNQYLPKFLCNRWAQAQLFRLPCASTSSSNTGLPHGMPSIWPLLTTTFQS